MVYLVICVVILTISIIKVIKAYRYNVPKEIEHYIPTEEAGDSSLNFLDDTSDKNASKQKSNMSKDSDMPKEKMEQNVQEVVDEEFEKCQAHIYKTVGVVNDQLDKVLKKLTETAEENTKAFVDALGKQQDALQTKLGETEAIIEDIKKLSNLLDAISTLEKTIADHNKEINNLNKNLKLFVNKIIVPDKINIKVPNNIKIFLMIFAGLIIGACIISIAAFFC